MDVEIDKTGSDDEIAAVNLINFEFRISNFGEVGDPTVDDGEISNLIALVGGIDNAAVADDEVHCAEIPPQR
jgi:hypothetical protein